MLPETTTQLDKVAGTIAIIHAAAVYLRNLSSSKAVANLIEYATPDVHLCAEYACTATAPTSVEVSLEHLCAPTFVRLVRLVGLVHTSV